MDLLLSLIVRLAGERGQTMAEYAVVIVWIALLVIVGATALGHALSGLFSSAATKI